VFDHENLFEDDSTNFWKELMIYIIRLISIKEKKLADHFEEHDQQSLYL